MRGIACKDHPTMNEARHAAALEGVKAVPFLFEWHAFAQHRADIGFDILVADARFAIDVPAKLEVETPDIVGLFVKERRLAAIEGRIEPEPAFGRAVALHLDVGDQEIVLEDATLEFKAQQIAHRGTIAVAGQQPAGFDAVGAVGGLHLDPDDVAILLDTGQRMAPTYLRIGHGRERFGQDRFGMILLEIDERRHLLVLHRQEIVLVNRLLAVSPEHLALFPDHALGDHCVGNAQPVEDFKRPLRVANGLRTRRNEI